MAIGKYIATARLEYVVEGHVHIDKWLKLKIPISQKFGLDYEPPPEGSAITEFTTETGVRLGFCLRGMTFTARGTYWDYDEKINLVRRQMDDFVKRNPELKVIDSFLEVSESDNTVIHQKFDSWPPPAGSQSP